MLTLPTAPAQGNIVNGFGYVMQKLGHNRNLAKPKEERVTLPLCIINIGSACLLRGIHTHMRDLSLAFPPRCVAQTGCLKNKLWLMGFGT